MKIKKMILDTFKGVTHGEYDFSDVTTVSGKNGVGKTTLADAYFWLFTDKDYELQSNPEIHPDFMAESEPSVTVILDVDGKDVKLRKFQTDMRTKKQKEANAPVRIANKYEINDVPKTQKDFVRDIEDKGIDVEKFLLLSHPEIFTSQKSADCRKTLFGMIEDVTDKTVADMIPECADVSTKLDDYTVDEITAMSKATVKRSKEQLDSLPNQIIGMEKSKVEVDSELPDKIKVLAEEINADTAELEKAKAKSSVTAIENRIKELRNRKTEMYNNANSERMVKYREAYAKCDVADDEYTDAKRELSKIQTSGDGINASFKQTNELIKRLTTELANIKAEKYTGRTKCPTCGQMIPKADVEKAKAKWEEQKKARVKDAEDKLRAVKTQADGYKAEGSKLSIQKESAEKKLADAKTKLDELRKECTQYSEPITPDYTEIDAEIASLNAEKEKCNEYVRMAYEIAEVIAKKRGLLQTYVKAQAVEANNAHIDEQIAEAKESLKAYAQAKADAESMLYQIQLISQKKNELLSEQVNSHFTKVKFRLFQTLKNGEIKDDCTPMVLCSDGEYRDMTYSANTAAIVMAKLDICSGLQKFYGQNLPIWLDGAECLDEENRKALAMDNQLILLCVTEDERLVVK